MKVEGSAEDSVGGGVGVVVGAKVAIGVTVGTQVMAGSGSSVGRGVTVGTIVIVGDSVTATVSVSAGVKVGDMVTVIPCVGDSVVVGSTHADRARVKVHNNIKMLIFLDFIFRTFFIVIFHIIHINPLNFCSFYGIIFLSNRVQGVSLPR